MTNDDFEDWKQKLKAKAFNNPTLHKHTERYWYEIRNRFYNFITAEIIMEQLNSMKRSDLLAFYEVGAAVITL